MSSNQSYSSNQVTFVNGAPVGYVTFIEKMKNQANAICNHSKSTQPDFDSKKNEEDEAKQRKYDELRQEHNKCVTLIKTAVEKSILKALVFNPKITYAEIEEPFELWIGRDPPLPYEHVMRGHGSYPNYSRQIHQAAGIFETTLEQVSREFNIKLIDGGYLIRSDSFKYKIIAKW